MSKYQEILDSIENGQYTQAREQIGKLNKKNCFELCIYAHENSYSIQDLIYRFRNLLIQN